MNGVIIDQIGEFPMQNRWDLQIGVKRSSPTCTLQDALRQSHGRRNCVFCGCQSEEGVLVELKVVCWNGDRYRVDRWRTDDPHRNDCIFALPDDEYSKEPPLPTSLLFEVPGEPPKHEFAGLGAGGAGGLRFVTFSRLVFSAGYTRAWFQENESASNFAEVRCPEAAHIFAEIDSVLRETPLADAMGGYEGARCSGGGLVFGVLDEELPDWVETEEKEEVVPKDFPVPLRLGGYCGGKIAYFGCTASAGQISALRKSVSIFGKTIRPPYLFMAVLEPDWSVRRLTLKPVYLDGPNFSFVDSRAEDSFYSGLIAAGIPFYRALDRMEDFTALAASVPLFDVAAGHTWPYCCDGLQFMPEYAVVSELRGFRPGSNQMYDKLFDLKGTAWPQFCASSGGRLHYAEYNAWDLPECVTKKWIPVGMERVLLPQPAPRVLSL